LASSAAAPSASTICAFKLSSAWRAWSALVLRGLCPGAAAEHLAL
jgi:hypothetical protein